MKWYQSGVLLLLSGLLICQMNCDQLIDDVLKEGVEVSVEEPLFQGEDVAPAKTVPIVQGLQISKKSGLGKTCFQGIGVKLDRETLLVLSQDASHVSFEGSLINNGTVPVQFKLYISAAGGLSDPASQASLIATKLLSPGTHSILGLGSFNESASIIASNRQAFFNANPTAETVYFYLDATGSALVDVLVESLTMDVGAVIVKSYTLDEGDLSQYANQVDAIQSVHFLGSFSNQAPADVLIQVYIDLNGEQKIMEVNVPAVGVVLLSENNAHFVSGGENALENSLYQLMNDPAVTTITYYLLMASSRAIHINSQIVLNGSAMVSL